MSYKSLVPVIAFLPFSIEIFTHYGDQNQSHKPTCSLSNHIGLGRMPDGILMEIVCNILSKVTRVCADV